MYGRHAPRHERAGLRPRGDGLPGIYRWLAQWRAALDAGWAAVTADEEALAAAREEADRLVEDFVGRLAYTPRTTRADLRSAGLGAAVGAEDRRRL